MDVRHVARLAGLKLQPTEEKEFDRAFTDTLKTVNQINEIDTSDTQPTYQVTGLTNISRPDRIDKSRTIPANKVYSLLKHTPDGLIIIPPVLDESRES
jgi:aspartyl-tRNA(Asn)/glutamyl-tRNA(Gln) amidotransferase subunit C